ncbi:MAG: DUF1653 domain-containing protein [Desulfovibrionaceae bacterium]
MEFTMFFRHYKGKYYQKISEVLNVHTESIMVLYNTLYSSSPRIFVREKENFEGSLLLDGIKVKRFNCIEECALPEEARNYIIHTQSIFSLLNI